MGIFDDLFSSTAMLNEQLSRDVLDIIPENSFSLAIIDSDGSVWTNDQTIFGEETEKPQFMSRICQRIGDGAEVVLTNIGETTLLASDIQVDTKICGYVILAIPNSSPSSVLSNIDIFEFALRQISLHASVIHKNNSLHHEKLNKTNFALSS